VYLAVVPVEAQKIFAQKEKITVSNYLGRHPKNRKKFAVVEKKKGRFATTDFYFITEDQNEEIGEYCYLIAVPKTGRTHQIRVHLSNLGIPILGDSIYSKQASRYPRMYLHAYYLKLKGMEGEDKEFLSPFPKDFPKSDDMEKIIDIIKSKIKNEF
jgi:23S rRNA pseudouridine1911/1915/1917 synthase